MKTSFLQALGVTKLFGQNLKHFKIFVWMGWERGRDRKNAYGMKQVVPFLIELNYVTYFYPEKYDKHLKDTEQMSKNSCLFLQKY